MTVEKLERVMWRLRSLHPNEAIMPYSGLKRAIMLEIGTDQRTYNANKKALVDLGWIRAHSKTKVRLTGEDLS